MARFLLVVLILTVVTAAAGANGEYCRDTLDGLLICHDFMFDDVPVASSACCVAYSVAFDADPFCLCYIANGVYGWSTGYNVNVTHAMEIPVSCGLITPPIKLCEMHGLVLPPYEPSVQSPTATTAQSPVASTPPLQQAPVSSSPPPSFTLPSPTSNGVLEFLSVPIYVVIAVAVSSLSLIY
ncbi:hypothetical protein ABZP36_031724 [Zizania latifolia]